MKIDIILVPVRFRLVRMVPAPLKKEDTCASCPCLVGKKCMEHTQGEHTYFVKHPLLTKRCKEGMMDKQ